MYKAKKRMQPSPIKVSKMRVFTYRRVSTTEQAEGGSLNEQRRLIEEFCRNKNIDIVEVVEDIQTAASTGRENFEKMMRRLKRGQADGVVFHKVDRSTRNYRDWQTISELMDRGIYVAFAGEGLESTNPSGRFCMDVHATMAVHYIRNLKQEIHKGISGRVRQGLCPWPAPLGYLNNAGGRDASKKCFKDLDPQRAPLIREMFELYVSRRYTLKALATEMASRGLRNQRGKVVDYRRIGPMLDNPFYTGLIPYDGELFPGKHEPIISAALWKRVQELRSRKTNVEVIKYNFLFRQLLRCGICDRSLVGELQKGHVYYRCHHRGQHETNSIREDVVLAQVEQVLSRISLSPEEVELVRRVAQESSQDETRRSDSRRKALLLERGQAKAREAKALDGYVTGVVSASDYQAIKHRITIDLLRIDQELKAAKNAKNDSTIHSFLELLERSKLAELSENKEKQRGLLVAMFSNFQIAEKKVSTQPKKWVEVLLDARKFLNGGPRHAQTRNYLVEIARIADDPDAYFFLRTS